MKKNCNLIFLGLLGCIVVFTTSCSFQSNLYKNELNITDISENTTYSEIISQGFMGGSLIYNSSDNALGQLKEGVTVAIRLSNADRREVDDSEAVFKECNDSAVYGLIIIDKINTKSISFESKLFNFDGSILFQKEVLLNENENADLNDDGHPDIKYSMSNLKRDGYEQSMFLSFLSSQEELNITMYSVLKEQYPGKNYPNGIVGINNDNRFIVQKYTNTETAERSVISGIYKGDFVIDNLKNKYQRVINNKYARYARSVNDEDLEDLDEDLALDNEVFYFTDKDFAFSTPDDFLNVLPKEITDLYKEYSGIDKANKILEEPELMKIIDNTQGSILPSDEKEDIFNQFGLLSQEEVVQINRVFLEKNFPVSCPQRVTVSNVITEVLPLSSVVFTSADAVEDIIDDASHCASDAIVSIDRNASASFIGCKSVEEYEIREAALEKDYSKYKSLFKINDFEIPVKKISNDDKTVNAKTSLLLKNSLISIGLKGSFSSTWGSVKSSLGAAAFFKVNADVGIKLYSDYNKSFDETFEGIKEETSEATIKTGREIKLPLIKKTVNLYEFELCQATNIANFCIGPILIGINLDMGIGLPITMDLEMDCNLSYSAYMTGLAKTGVSVGVNYGVTWKKKWFIKVPNPYVDWSGNASASADAICYFDQNMDTLNFEVSKLKVGVSVAPYIKAGLSMSVATVVHAGCGIKFGVNGYANFGYYDPYLQISYGLNDTSSIYANAYLGLKGVKFLGINIGNIGKGWNWELLDMDKTVIPETTLFQYKIN
ncbi:hypothetical protein [Treponema peruense]|uniref:Lipoprotein n=1 Tax=Treponema peruense TaxID=2787628 RepID=A0A7T3V5C1_9SPIR|nr:hypothetical protein [Treponema peruense]QQA01467.1 hypothetical protein IWA51_02295 [Treponema peruense]